MITAIAPIHVPADAEAADDTRVGHHSGLLAIARAARASAAYRSLRRVGAHRLAHALARRLGHAPRLKSSTPSIRWPRTASGSSASSSSGERARGLVGRRRAGRRARARSREHVGRAPARGRRRVDQRARPCRAGRRACSTLERTGTAARRPRDRSASAARIAASACLELRPAPRATAEQVEQRRSRRARPSSPSRAVVRGRVAKRLDAELARTRAPSAPPLRAPAVSPSSSAEHLERALGLPDLDVALRGAPAPPALTSKPPAAR